MTKANKIIVAIALLIALVSVSVCSYAREEEETTGLLDPRNITASTDITTGGIQGIGQDLVGILQTVGVVISVVILLVLGIKYMMGSAEEKADYKKSMIPYIIGAILIFGATAIAGMVFDLASGLADTATGAE